MLDPALARAVDAFNADVEAVRLHLIAKGESPIDAARIARETVMRRNREAVEAANG